MTTRDRVTHDLLETLEVVRSRTFERLEGLTDAEYQWQPVPDCLTIRRTDDGVFRADSRPPDSSTSAGAPEPVTTIAWRMWHIGSGCMRGYLTFFEDVPDLGDRYEWPGTADLAKLALEEDWARFVTRIEALGDERLLSPIGELAEPHGWGKSSYLALALHALDEAAHHGGEIGLMRDLYLRQGSA
jgi:hypothetical protein